MNAIFKLRKFFSTSTIDSWKNTLLDSQKRKNVLLGVKKKKSTTLEPKRKVQSINTKKMLLKAGVSNQPDGVTTIKI